MRMKLLMVASVMATMLLVQPVQAQSNVADVQKATVLFDLRIGMMRDGKLMKSLGIEDELNQMAASSGEDYMADVDRIFGAFALPDSVAEMMSMEDSSVDLPMDFFVQIKFKDADSATMMFDKGKADSEAVEINGKTYYRPNGAPPNIVTQLADPTTVEIGTESYITQSSRGRDLFSEGLNQGWSKAPNHAFRLVVDLEAERKLLNEALDMAKQQSGGDAMMEAYLGLFNHANDLRLSFDLDNETLLEIGSTAGDEEKAKELQSGLASILGMAKMTGPMAAAQIPDPAAAKMVTTIIESLDATQDGANVRISIPRPEGFDGAVKAGVEQAKGMMMLPGGASGGDFGNDN